MPGGGPERKLVSMGVECMVFKPTYLGPAAVPFPVDATRQGMMERQEELHKEELLERVQCQRKRSFDLESNEAAAGETCRTGPTSIRIVRHGGG